MAESNKIKWQSALELADTLATTTIVDTTFSDFVKPQPKSVKKAQPDIEPGQALTDENVQIGRASCRERV